jgi:hypothetical protein
MNADSGKLTVEARTDSSGWIITISFPSWSYSPGQGRKVFVGEPDEGALPVLLHVSYR